MSWIVTRKTSKDARLMWRLWEWDSREDRQIFPKDLPFSSRTVEPASNLAGEQWCSLSLRFSPRPTPTGGMKLATAGLRLSSVQENPAAVLWARVYSTYCATLHLSKRNVASEHMEADAPASSQNLNNVWGLSTEVDKRRYAFRHMPYSFRTMALINRNDFLFYARPMVFLIKHKLSLISVYTDGWLSFLKYNSECWSNTK